MCKRTGRSVPNQMWVCDPITGLDIERALALFPAYLVNLPLQDERELDLVLVHDVAFIPDPVLVPARACSRSRPPTVTLTSRKSSFSTSTSTSTPSPRRSPRLRSSSLLASSPTSISTPSLNGAIELAREHEADGEHAPQNEGLPLDAWMLRRSDTAQLARHEPCSEQACQGLPALSLLLSPSMSCDLARALVLALARVLALVPNPDPGPGLDLHSRTSERARPRPLPRPGSSSLLTASPTELDLVPVPVLALVLTHTTRPRADTTSSLPSASRELAVRVCSHYDSYYQLNLTKNSFFRSRWTCASRTGPI